MFQWLKDIVIEMTGYMFDPDQPIACAQAWASVATGVLLGIMFTWNW